MPMGGELWCRTSSDVMIGGGGCGRQGWMSQVLSNQSQKAAVPRFTDSITVSIAVAKERPLGSAYFIQIKKQLINLFEDCGLRALVECGQRPQFPD